MTGERYEIDIEVESAHADGVDVEPLRALLARLLDDERVEDGSALAVRIAGDALLRELNRTHRGIDEPTDVLSFGAEEGEVFPAVEGEARYLGDIAVSTDEVRRRASAAGLEFETELAHVILHGALHLLGHHHDSDADAAAMRAREEALLGPAIHAGEREHADE